ncbi:hypothetical protein CAPTEDRAFT_195619 [Capitella teleta]|nr:hypothetical protein CAPTEDRAFT_195619 [Capitella teleta]|eukprot:ELU09346.1 hypothetical protein CAPTEDRAFT_195619 [Capitella teleta]
MGSQEEELKKLKVNIRAVLESINGGVELTRFNWEYQEVTMEPNINFKKFNCNSLVEFFQKFCSDTVSIRRNNEGSEMCMPVFSEKTAHVASLVSRTKTKKKKKLAPKFSMRKISPHKASFSFSPHGRSMAPRPYQKKYPPQNKQWQPNPAFSGNSAVILARGYLMLI